MIHTTPDDLAERAGSLLVEFLRAEVARIRAGDRAVERQLEIDGKIMKASRDVALAVDQLEKRRGTSPGAERDARRMLEAANRRLANVMREAGRL